MIRRKTSTSFLLLIPTSLLVAVSLYRIVFFSLYGYGVPVHAKSIMEYKKEYDEVNKEHPYEYPIHSLPDNDYYKLIDHDFSFNILNVKCKIAAPPLIVMVHSAPKNFAKRKIIRETWGSKKNKFLVLFALGTVNDENLQNKLLSENRKHKDFIQGSFLDAYTNLTYKHVMLFKYLIYHCPDVKYMVKSDDDIFVNLPTIANFLLEDVSPKGARDFLFCLPNYAKVVRSFRSYYAKWRLSYKEYPHKYHPPSCLGIFIIYSKQVIFNLYQEAQRTKYFWIDDLHITGHLFEKLHINHVNSRPYMIHEQDMRKVILHKKEILWPFLMSGPNLNLVQIKYLWYHVAKREPPESLIRVPNFGED